MGMIWFNKMNNDNLTSKCCPFHECQSRFFYQTGTQMVLRQEEHKGLCGRISCTAVRRPRSNVSNWTLVILHVLNAVVSLVHILFDISGNCNEFILGTPIFNWQGPDNKIYAQMFFPPVSIITGAEKGCGEVHTKSSGHCLISHSLPSLIVMLNRWNSKLTFDWHFQGDSCFFHGQGRLSWLPFNHFVVLSSQLVDKAVKGNRFVGVVCPVKSTGYDFYPIIENLEDMCSCPIFTNPVAGWYLALWLVLLVGTSQRRKITFLSTRLGFLIFSRNLKS